MTYIDNTGGYMGDSMFCSVGFDSQHVYLLSDAKKKVLEGSTELHNVLTYRNNIWIPIALDVCTTPLFLPPI
jgi:hypothetical protein